MTVGGADRKLAAILCADVCHYTALMGRDEVGTHNTYNAIKSEVFDRFIAVGGGEVVKSTGDGLIARFDSVIAAVECAIAVQSEIARREEEMEFRVGVNLGDIIEEDHDIFGDGVNVAARLQSAARPGGVCVSAVVRDQVKNKVPIEFRYAGSRRFKKSEPAIPIYWVGETSAGARASRLRNWVARKRVHLGIGALGALAVAITIGLPDMRHWVSTNISRAPDQEPTTPAFELPKSPSIAVLPFENLSANPEQAYFAEGVTRDLTTDLSKIPGLFVVSQHSSSAFKGKQVSVRQIGQALGVRYVLDGSIRRNRDHVRINSQLVDSQTGLHVWADRFDGQIGNLFEAQDRIVAAIVNELASHLSEGREKHFKARETLSISAYDAFLRGWARYRTNTPNGTRQALIDFERAIEIDPNFARAHAAVAAIYLTMIERDWFDIDKNLDDFEYVLTRRERRETLRRQAREHLAHALVTPSPLALQVSANLMLQERRYDEAVQEIVRAISIDPNDADSYLMLGTTLTWAGKASEALEPIRKAIRLNPHHPSQYLAQFGIAHFVLGEFENASKMLEQSAKASPLDHWPLIHLLATYGYTEQAENAKNTMKKINELLERVGHNKFKAHFAREDMPYRYEADRLRLLVGLQKAKATDLLIEFTASPI